MIKPSAIFWIGITLAIVITVATRGPDPFDPQAEISHRPIEKPADDYLGSQACRSCHPAEYDSWFDSYHRTMTQVATPDAVLGSFPQTFEDGVRTMRLSREGDAFWVEMDYPDPRSGLQRTDRRPIVMTTGSHHMQIYWLSLDDDSRTLAQLQYVYLIPEQRWVKRRSTLLTTQQAELVGEFGRWNETCIKCHSTHGRMLHTKLVRGGQGFDPHSLETQAAEFGISCEACHGPGADHVESNGSPIQRYSQYLSDGEDASIVNPLRLDHARASHICASCHSTAETVDLEAVRNWSSHGWAFRPGDDLTASPMRVIVRGSLDGLSEARRAEVLERGDYLRDTFWPDGMIRVSGGEFNGMSESPCYLRGDLSCLSCHQLHQKPDDHRSRERWADDQLAREMNGNQACVQCHPEYESDEALTRHTHHPADSAGSQCYNCHMPNTSFGLLKAMRSHQIDTPDVRDSTEVGRPNACNQCHLDRTLEWTAQALLQQYGIPVPELQQEERSVAASVLWMLRGDAAQRALMTWSFGWEPALEASGSHWQQPYLDQLDDDAYRAIRLMAERSRASLQGFSGERSRAGNAELLLDSNGELDPARVREFIAQRNNRPVNLRE